MDDVWMIIKSVWIDVLLEKIFICNDFKVVCLIICLF